MLVKLSSILILVLCIVSCQSRDPLSRLSHHQLVAALWGAARSAERTLNVTPPLGSTYVVCMDETQVSSHCQLFLRTMLADLRSQRAFQSVTLLNLKDSARYLTIRDAYVSYVMSHIPKGDQ